MRRLPTFATPPTPDAATFIIGWQLSLRTPRSCKTNSRLLPRANIPRESGNGSLRRLPRYGRPFSSPARARNMSAWAAHCTKRSRPTAARSRNVMRFCGRSCRRLCCRSSIRTMGASHRLTKRRTRSPRSLPTNMRWRRCGARGASSRPSCLDTASANMSPRAWRGSSVSKTD